MWPSVSRALSRISFAVGGTLFFLGLHRFIFGVHPKLTWDRDLPWDLVSYEWCFVGALGLAAVGALLGRAAHVAPNELAADGAPPFLVEPTDATSKFENRREKDIAR